MPNSTDKSLADQIKVAKTPAAIGRLLDKARLYTPSAKTQRKWNRLAALREKELQKIVQPKKVVEVPPPGKLSGEK